MKINNNEMKIIQYNHTQKPDLIIHIGDAFFWSVPIISKALMDLLIGFLSYTSDVVMPDYQNSSKLDLTVLEALDI